MPADTTLNKNTKTLTTMNFATLSSLLFVTLIDANNRHRDKNAKRNGVAVKCTLDAATCSTGQLNATSIKACHEADLKLCLKRASESGNVEAIKFLAGDGVFKVNVKKNIFNDALGQALTKKSASSVEALLGLGFVNPKAHSNVFAMSDHDLTIARLLVKDGRVDPSVGKNMLMSYAVEAKDVELVKMLLADERVQKSMDTYLKEKAEALVAPVVPVPVEEKPLEKPADEEKPLEKPAVEEKPAEKPAEEKRDEPIALEGVEKQKVVPTVSETPIVPAVTREPTVPNPGPSGTYSDNDSGDDDDYVIIVRPSLRDIERKSTFGVYTPFYTSAMDRHIAIDKEAFFNSAGQVYASAAWAGFGLLALLFI